MTGYVIIYKKLISYHNKIKQRNKFISISDEQQMKESAQQVKKFFFFICQFLCIWSLYMIVEIVSKAIGGITSPWPQRMVDIMSECLSISSILMLLGISNSIKRAMNTQVE